MNTLFSVREIKDWEYEFPSSRRPFLGPHPWEVSVIWNPKYYPPGSKKARPCWVANIEPGFVNGYDPRVPGAEDPNDAPQYGANGALLSGTEVLLLDRPRVPLYEFGDIQDPSIDPQTGDQSYAAIPPFFKNDPITKPGSGNSVTADSSGNLSVQESSSPQFTRNLFLCQLYLTQARSTFKMDTTISGNLVTGQIADYTATYNTSSLQALGGRVRLDCGPSIPSQQQSTLAEREAGAYGDGGFDTVLLATVWLLTPLLKEKETCAFDDVDANGIAVCTPFVEHFNFWNLAYYSLNPRPQNLQFSGLDPSLAFFVGQYTFAAATQGALDAEEQALVASVFNANDNSGVFYTLK